MVFLIGFSFLADYDCYRIYISYTSFTCWIVDEIFWTSVGESSDLQNIDVIYVGEDP